FRNRDQAAAVQTIISNPGDSYLVVLPTGAGKSDIVFLSSLYERKRGRITLLILPFVALRYDLVGRGRALGLNIVEWSSGVSKDSIAKADILLLSIESIDTGRFRQQFTELLISKSGKSLIARIFFDEAHTILSHWNFRPSFQAVSDLASMQVPIVLLSATVPPNKVHQVQRVYNRPDLRLIRAPSTMRANIRYSVERVPDEALKDTLMRRVGAFLAHASPKDRALVFCMSVSTTEELYDGIKSKFDTTYYYHGQLDESVKKIVLDKWIAGEYKLVFCTSGFGVGIDYGSVALVIHYGGMWQLVDFVQESGRAGRDGNQAQSSVLL
ncbi:P-loop containing nucleoside triphosphate hydrolase protein, partial [Lipomyces tetrasporus]